MFNSPLLTFGSAVSLLFLTTGTVQAAVMNRGFETGDLSSWMSIGQVTVEDEEFGVAPAEGTYQVVLETLQDETGTSGFDLETFLGLSTGSLTGLGAIEGSAIKQNITAGAGDILTFSWNFLSDQDPTETDFNDFALFTLSNTFTQLADTSSPNTISFSRLFQETGYRSYSYTIPSDGTFILGFGVVDIGDDSVNSALLIDDVRVSKANVKVPEFISPLSLIAFGMGILLNRSLKKK